MHKHMMEIVSQRDLRAQVHVILKQTAFDTREMTGKELIKLEIVQMYPEFKIGEIWNDIKDDIKEMGVKVTSDDLNWMMTCIERAGE